MNEYLIISEQLNIFLFVYSWLKTIKFQFTNFIRIFNTPEISSRELKL